MTTKTTDSVATPSSAWKVRDDAPTAQEYYYVLLINQAIDKGDDVQHFLHLCTLMSLRTGKSVDEIKLLPMPEFDLLVNRMWAPLGIWARMRGTALKGMRQ